MIKKIKNLSDSDAKKMLESFFSVYFEKGFGVMNKTDIETLLYHVLKEGELLNGKCFDDSLALQISEAKARKLNYDSKVKYLYRNQEEVDVYLKKEIGRYLKNARFSSNGKEIIFAIEDKYLRVALNAKMRAEGDFSDSSFNKDIVSLDKDTFYEMISSLLSECEEKEIKKKLTVVQIEENVENFLKSFIYKVFESGVISGISQIASLLNPFL
jgi:hypothetical protein